MIRMTALLIQFLMVAVFFIIPLSVCANVNNLCAHLFESHFETNLIFNGTIYSPTLHSEWGAYVADGQILRENIDMSKGTYTKTQKRQMRDFLAAVGCLPSYLIIHTS